MVYSLNKITQSNNFLKLSDVLCCFIVFPPNINYIVNTSEKEAQKKKPENWLRHS